MHTQTHTVDAKTITPITSETWGVTTNWKSIRAAITENGLFQQWRIQQSDHWGYTQLDFFLISKDKIVIFKF